MMWLFVVCFVFFSLCPRPVRFRIEIRFLGKNGSRFANAFQTKTLISGPYGARTLSSTIQCQFEIRTMVPQQRELTPTPIGSKRYDGRGMVSIPDRYIEVTLSSPSSPSATSYEWPWHRSLTFRHLTLLCSTDPILEFESHSQTSILSRARRLCPRWTSLSRSGQRFR
jgi:hypothetical protein